MIEISLACPFVWDADPLCEAWGAPGSHGCRKEPGHEGLCVCACGVVGVVRRPYIPVSTLSAEFARKLLLDSQVVGGCYCKDYEHHLCQYHSGFLDGVYALQEYLEKGEPSEQATTE